MQQIDIIVRQIIILTLLGATGFVAGKTKYLPESTGPILSKCVVKLTTPLLIIATMSQYSFKGKTLETGLFIYFFGLIFLFLSFLTSVFMSSRLKLDGPAASVYSMCSTFGNVMFMAYPLLTALYGTKGIIYAIFFNLSNDTLLWTLGIYLVNRHNTVNWKDNLKHLINGNTVSFTIGILLSVINFQNLVVNNNTVAAAYRLFNDSLGKLGGTTIYISMVFIGIILSEVKIDGVKGLLQRYPVFVMSLFKLILIPAAAFLLMSLFDGILDPFVKKVVVLQLGMPAGTIVAALASQYDSDYKFATENIFVTTIASVLTLPLLAYTVEYIKLF
ncbi:MAG: AEC family transporter [Bacillota bacterium]|nr:AEC family transporter [Bacillota bacterium]